MEVIHETRGFGFCCFTNYSDAQLAKEKKINLKNGPYLLMIARYIYTAELEQCNIAMKEDKTQER